MLSNRMIEALEHTDILFIYYIYTPIKARSAEIQNNISSVYWSLYGPDRSLNTFDLKRMF